MGSGASAVGVLSGLESAGVEDEITLFSSEAYLASTPRGRYRSGEPEGFYAEVYADLRSRAVGYPPRKTFFGDGVECHTVDGERRFFNVDMFGGQTNIWGGTVLSFTEDDLVGWPISRADLEPHYRAIADLIGIAGRDSALTAFLSFDYANRPPVKQLRGFAALEEHLRTRPETRLYRFHAGVPPSAVETRPEAGSSCIRCGECMVGCLRDSIYAARSTLKERLDRGRVAFVGRNVVALSPRDGGVDLRLEDGRTERYSRVFLCAGCVGTTEILMRSLALRSGPILQDNAVYQFPIVNLSRHTDGEKELYFGLTNLLLLLEPMRAGAPLLQIQLYPNVDYLWRTILPRWCWGVARHPVRWWRDRLIWARAYLDADDSYRYAASLEGDRLVFREAAAPDRAKLAPCRTSLRDALRGSGFFVPPVPAVCSHTSAHLAGSFPYGEGPVPVGRDGEVLPRVHIADSSCFPKSSVLSPTLTVMANARRTAIEATLR